MPGGVGRHPASDQLSGLSLVSALTDGLVLMLSQGRHGAGLVSATITRQQFGMWSIWYRLKAKFDARPIAEEEIRATGWDRSDYAA